MRVYAYGQVRCCHEKLQLKPDLLPFAAAAYCTEEEFTRSSSELTTLCQTALGTVRTFGSRPTRFERRGRPQSDDKSGMEPVAL